MSNLSFNGNELNFEVEVEAQGLSIFVEVGATFENGKLAGVWTASSDGNELGSGAITARKVVTLTLAGKWTTTASLNNGEQLAGSMELKGKTNDMTGSMTIHEDLVAIDRITVKDKSVRMEFVLDVEGEGRDIVVDASLGSDKSLAGKWAMLDSAGNEVMSGDWKAEPEQVENEKGAARMASKASEFDGSKLGSFRGYHAESIGDGWSMKDGVLHLDGSKNAGDVVTRSEYGDFELEFDWKISTGGNSGVMYRVSLGDKQPYLSGPEYQVLDDDAHADGKFESRTSGSLYALYVPQNKIVKSVGRWNSAKIVVKGNAVEHWLNGEKVVEAEIGSDDWIGRVAGSKFKNWKKFGKNEKGRICFQDHGNPVWFRNIKITSLD